MPGPFLDTNILIRYLTRDDEVKAEAVFLLLRRIELGEEKVVTSPLVIFETVYTLQRSYRVPRATIREALTYIIALPGIELPNKSVYVKALDLFERKNISFADAYNVVYMQSHRLGEIYSWDTDFDNLEGIVRVEPPNAS